MIKKIDIEAWQLISETNRLIAAVLVEKTERRTDPVLVCRQLVEQLGVEDNRHSVVTHRLGLSSRSQELADLHRALLSSSSVCVRKVPRSDAVSSYDLQLTIPITRRESLENK